MKKPPQRSPRFEQLELFVERPKRPTWGNLPQEARQGISKLIAQMLLEHLRGNDAENGGKEVLDER